MIPQLNPNGWSCLPTAFAMVLELPVEDIIKEIGHDGSEIYWPKLMPPYNRRGFHIQELLYLCYKLDYTVTPFAARPQLVSADRSDPKPILGHEKIIEEVMTDNVGVLTGILESGVGHALAWDGYAAINPSDKKRGPLQNFQIQTFWRIIKSKTNEEIV